MKITDFKEEVESILKWVVARLSWKVENSYYMVFIDEYGDLIKKHVGDYDYFDQTLTHEDIMADDWYSEAL